MTTIGLVTPTPRQMAFDLGIVAPLAQLFFRVAGSATPGVTYSDVGLSVQNTYPVVADGNGLFGPIYLPWGVQFDLELQDQHGNTIWTQPNIGNGGIGQATYDVTRYGAVGNGVTDDSAAIQAAITAAANAGGGQVYFPIGTYRLVSALSLTASGVSFKGASRTLSVLQWTDAATKGLVIAGAATFNALPMLSANASIGDKTVTVASAAGLFVGGYAYLQDNGAHTGSFLTRIASIVGTTIGLQEAMPCNLTTAAGAQLFSYTALLTGIDISDLTFSCVAGSGTANKLTLLELRRCENPRVTNCEFNGSVAPLITPITCLFGVIERCHFRNGLTVAASGVEVQTSTGFSIISCQVEMVMFGFTPARSPYTSIIGCKIAGRESIDQLGRGIRFSDNANFSRSVGNRVSDNGFFGIYFQDAAFCESIGDTVSFNGISSAPGQHGIAVGGFLTAGSHHCSIVGATIRGSSGYGIIVTSSDGVAVEDMFTSIVGCNISGCVQGAVVAFAASHTSINGGNYSGPSTTVGGILRVTAGASACVIANCSVVAESGAPDAVNTAGGAGDTWVLNISTTLLIEVNATDIQSQTQATWTSVVPVATGANTNETTAWTKTPPAKILKAAGQKFELKGVFLCAANGNNKTFTVYIGTNTVSVTGAYNNVNVEVRAYGWWQSSNQILWFVIITAGTAIVKNVSSQSVDDWTLAQPFKLTMTNGSASAGDISFIGGDLRIE